MIASLLLSLALMLAVLALTFAPFVMQSGHRHLLSGHPRSYRQTR